MIDAIEFHLSLNLVATEREFLNLCKYVDVYVYVLFLYLQSSKKVK